MKNFILTIAMTILSQLVFAQNLKIEDKSSDQISYNEAIKSKEFGSDAIRIAEMSYQLAKDFNQLNADDRRITKITATKVVAPSGVEDRIHFLFSSSSFKYVGISATTISTATLSVYADLVCGPNPLSPCKYIYSKP